jgi:putrescine importer
MEKPVQLQRSLTFFHLTLLGLAYMAPLTVFSTFGIVESISKGVTPSAYLVALFAMLFTAYSYGRMGKAFPIAGSAYSYTQKTINSHLGFMVGWALLMDYLFIPMINFLIMGLYLKQYFPAVPFSVWVIAMVLIVTILNVIGMKVTVTMNMVLLGFQYLVLIIFSIFCVKALLNGTGQGTIFSLTPFINSHTSFVMVFSGASILCLSFLGFDALTTFSEETIKPEKTIPKAIMFVTLFAGICFILISYISHLVHPDFTTYKSLDTAAIEVAKTIGGTFFNALFIAAIIVTCFTSAMASHASVSRILFAMGRDSIIPKKFFAYVHPKFRTPMNNIILVGVIGLASLFTDLVTITSFINFGALIAFTFVNLSVIAHYFVKGKQRSLKGTILYLIVPLIGAIISLKLWSGLDSHSMTLGGIWAAVGFIYLLIKTKLFRVKPPQIDFNAEDSGSDLSL